MHLPDNTLPPVVLSLKRGAASHDPVTDLWLLDGWRWKGVTDPDGAKLVTGERRADPWVVHEITATAVPSWNAYTIRPGCSPTPCSSPNANATSTAAPAAPAPTRPPTATSVCSPRGVNRYCAATGRADSIPPDPAGPVTTSRFRRSLAWNIVRQPKGLIAAAIQYGHIQLRVTQGYAGTADSGFLDDLCFEDWLLRLEQFADAQHRLDDGENVSGPAAAGYQRRVGEVHARFAGRIVHTARQARQLIADPALQVFPGHGMHCVFNPTTALCQLREGNDHRATPDIEDCRPRCPNIARTDTDIAVLRTDLDHLEQILNDPPAPTPRHARDQTHAERLRALIARHDQHQTEPESR